MRHRILIITPIIIATFWLCGCEEVETKDYYYNTEYFSHSTATGIIATLAAANLFGPLPLVKLRGTLGVTGQTGGSFFLGSGSISGYITSTGYMIYAFRPRPTQMALIVIPLKKVAICIDNVPTPRVHHKFNLMRVRSKTPRSEYLPSPLEERTYGQIINDYTVVKVTLTISEEQLQDNEYLLFKR